jgi:hypothetical protein
MAANTWLAGRQRAKFPKRIWRKAAIVPDRIRIESHLFFSLLLKNYQIANPYPLSGYSKSHT